MPFDDPRYTAIPPSRKRCNSSAAFTGAANSGSSDYGAAWSEKGNVLAVASHGAGGMS